MNIEHCRACNAEIIFLKTAKYFMPCDASSVAPGDALYKHGVHVSHYATCTSPDSFRRRKKEKA